MRWADYGFNKITEAFMQGRNVTKEVDTLAKLATTNDARQALHGAVIAATQIAAIASRSKRMQLNFGNEDSCGFMAWLRTGDADLGMLKYQALQAGNDRAAFELWHRMLFTVVEDVRRAGLEITVSARGQEEKPAKVEIVGMPERQTTTEIARDSKNDIVSSVQVEKDIS